MLKHHGINYIELSVTDMEAAQQFYGSAFGWEFTEYGPGYAGIKVDGEEVAGLTTLTEFRPGGPLVVLYSNDLEASLEAVKAAGGGIAKEIFEFPGGRRFQFLDPAGNELGVWSDS